ncbi:MAG: hypothetical protein M5U26_11870 [Planctomycetota bacterium]|nr:hypothetical protein [Planctomycetota bacterium]
MYVFKCELRSKYGLTTKLIEKLGPPDWYGPNPHNPRAQAHFYQEGRVEVFAREHEAEIRRAAEKRARQKEKNSKCKARNT